jgi:carbonic anhydrase
VVFTVLFTLLGGIEGSPSLGAFAGMTMSETVFLADTALHGSPDRVCCRPPRRAAVTADLEGHLMTVTDDLVQNARAYAAAFDKGHLPMPPARQVAVVACMDARLNPFGLLGLSEGDAHVIRNAGGVITDDEIRSLVISQRLLGTREIILIHHSDCGMLTFTDDDFKAQIEADTGLRPGWAPESFRDPAADVLQSLARIAANPFIPHKDLVRGFVYSVTDGSLTEIT